MPRFAGSYTLDTATCDGIENLKTGGDGHDWNLTYHIATHIAESSSTWPKNLHGE